MEYKEGAGSISVLWECAAQTVEEEDRRERHRCA